MTARPLRPVWAEVDLGALAHNVRLCAGSAPPARLCAVVKADGYGHGAVAVARAALGAGADWLAVALVEEGVALRDAGIDAPVLLLSEPPPDALADAVAAGLVPTLYTLEGVAAAAAAARGRPAPLRVHVKVDTGMHRVGADVDLVPELVATLVRTPALHLEGLWTHLAVADERTPDAVAFTNHQLQLFEDVRADLARAGVVADMVHAANSAGAIAHPASRLDLVRCGIALYGEAPSAALEPLLEDDGDEGRGGGLRPVLSLRARVSLVRDLDAGERLSYGRVTPLRRATGWPRSPSGTPTACGGSSSPGAVRCSSEDGGAPWPAPSRWTRSSSTAGPAQPWPSVTRWS